MDTNEIKKDAIHCYKCDHVLDLSEETKIYRQDECDKCSAYIHCCKMCVYYDEHSYNECREPIAQRIVDKEKANFCDNYKLRPGGDPKQKLDNQLSAANALFKD